MICVHAEKLTPLEDKFENPGHASKRGVDLNSIDFREIRYCMEL